MNKRLWLPLIPALLFVALALAVQAGLTASAEAWVYERVIRLMSPFLTSLCKALSAIGSKYGIITICLLLAALPVTRKNMALPVWAAMALSPLANHALKELFARERPDILRLVGESGYSFPSGHAMNNAALYALLILLIFSSMRNQPGKYALAALCLALTLAIGYSRIYLGVHYAGDVLAGWLAGLSIALAIDLAWDRWQAGHDRRAAGEKAP